MSTFLFFDVSNLKKPLFISFVFCVGQLNAGLEEVKPPTEDDYFSEKSLAVQVVTFFCQKCGENNQVAKESTEEEAAKEYIKDIERLEEDNKKLSDEVNTLNDINDEKTKKVEELTNVNHQWKSYFDNLDAKWQNTQPEPTNLEKQLKEKDNIIDSLKSELTRLAAALNEETGGNTSSCVPVGTDQTEESATVESILTANELLLQEIKQKDIELAGAKRALEEGTNASTSVEITDNEEFVHFSVLKSVEDDMTYNKEKYDESERRNVELRRKMFEMGFDGTRY